MIVGFTGSSEGMTEEQAKALWAWLGLLKQELKTDDEEMEFHHGDCVGADADADDLARIRKYKTVAHPPINEYKRAFKKSDVILEAKEYMARNRDIAKVCDVLIATPKEAEEIVRSGTWSTVRKARKFGKEVIVLSP